MLQITRVLKSRYAKGMPPEDNNHKWGMRKIAAVNILIAPRIKLYKMQILYNLGNGDIEEWRYISTSIARF